MSAQLCMAEFVDGARKVCLLIPEHPGDHAGVRKDSPLVTEIAHFAEVSALHIELGWCRERLRAIADIAATGPTCAHMDLIRAALEDT